MILALLEKTDAAWKSFICHLPRRHFNIVIFPVQTETLLKIHNGCDASVVLEVPKCHMKCLCVKLL